MQNQLRQNIIAGAVYLLFGLFVIFVLIPLGVDEPANVEHAALAPSYWPKIICSALAALGLAILVRSMLQLKKRPSTTAHKEVEQVPETTMWRAVVVVVGYFLLYALLEKLGFVLATVIALALLMLFAGERRVKILLPVSLGVPVALYLFFTKAASIPIPNGILETILSGG